MEGVSVIICCYNSGSKLILTLQHLAKQKLLPGINYEIVLVDNNCTDNSIEVASATWASLTGPFPLIIVKQPIAGLNNAREKGLQTASYEFAILCDDDNWLCDDYLQKVYKLFNKLPEAAIIGGVGEAVTDGTLPQWFIQLKGFGYAVGDEGRKTGYVNSVYGAGMSMRKSVFNSLVKNDFKFLLSDRKGSSLSSGGDTEICRLFQNAGYRIYLDTTLTFKHFLTANRLQWKYYLKLRSSFGEANAYLDLSKKGNSDKFKYFLSSVKFRFLNIKYLLFPGIFKTAACADFFQQLKMRSTEFKILYSYKSLQNK